MSGTSRKDSPERIAAILADASALGDGAAAKKHSVSTRTIQRYRQRHAESEDVAPLVAQYKEAIATDWIEQTTDARARILDRVLALVDVADDLHKVVGALKIVHDANVSERIIRGGLSTDSAGVAEPTATLTADALTRLERFVSRGNKQSPN